VILDRPRIASIHREKGGGKWTSSAPMRSVAQAVVGCWQDGEVTGLQVDDLSFEEARSLTARR
jgi:hypothetical protein